MEEHPVCLGAEILVVQAKLVEWAAGHFAVRVFGEAMETTV
jgi:hypothetical protein